MQVTYRCHRGGRETVYEQADVCFCCEEMQREWGIMLGFGICGHACTTSREVNLFGLHQYSTGTIIPSIIEIRFCPWCGEEIVVVRVRESNKPS